MGKHLDVAKAIVPSIEWMIIKKELMLKKSSTLLIFRWLRSEKM